MCRHMKQNLLVSICIYIYIIYLNDYISNVTMRNTTPKCWRMTCSKYS